MLNTTLLKGFFTGNTVVISFVLLLTLPAFGQTAQVSHDRNSTYEWLALQMVPQEYHNHPEFNQQSLDISVPNVELIQYRTNNSRTFYDIDGNYHTQQTAGTFHYKDNLDNWISIQNTPTVGAKGQVGINRTELPISVNTLNGKTVLQLTQSGQGIHYGSNSKLNYLDAAGEVLQTKVRSSMINSELENNKVTLKNYFSGIDRVQMINYWGVKTDMFINEALQLSDNVKFVELNDEFILPEGWDIIYGDGFNNDLGWNGSLLIVNNLSEIVGSISRAIAYDDLYTNVREERNGHSVLGGYSIDKNGNNFKVKIRIDADWFRNENLVYPLVIDPTVSNTYASNQAMQDKNTGFNSNCQTTMTLNMPVNAFQVTGTNTSYRIWSKGYIYDDGWDEHYADKVEQRSRIGCNGNWTATQNGSGTNHSGSSYSYTSASNGQDYSLTNQTIANGCYTNTSSLTYTWQGYQTYFPHSSGPAEALVAGCSFNYAELVTNTWVVTVTYTNRDYSVEWISANMGSSTWCPGETRNVSITLKNVGNSNWTSAGASGGVNFSYWWSNQNQDSNPREYPFINLAPGSQQTISFNVTAPATPGTYTFYSDLVRELFCWFRGNDSGNGCGPCNSAYSTTMTVADGYPVTASGAATLCMGESANLNASSTVAGSTVTNSTSGSISSLSTITRTNAISNSCANANQVTSVSVNLTHTYNADLEIRLIAPDGSSIMLMNDHGGSGDNVNATFITGGAALPTSNTTISGNYAPSTAFSSLTGTAQGTWTLSIYDDASGDAGTINSWSITIPSSTCATAYTWSPATGLSSTTIANPVATPASTTTYTVSSTNNGCTTTSNVTVTVNSPSSSGLTAGDWLFTGKNSTTYESASNWVVYDGSAFTFPSSVPQISNNVRIKPNGTCIVNQPTVTNAADGNFTDGSSVSANCNTITIESGATLTFSSNASHFHVKANWLNYGTMIPTNGRVKFIGSGAQSVFNNSGTESFYQMNIGANSITSLNSTNVNVTNALRLNGVVVTGSNIFHLTNNAADATSLPANAGQVFGTFRRSVGSNTNVHKFPVAVGTSASDRRLLELINNNLSGQSYIDCRVTNSFKGSGNQDDIYLDPSKATEVGELITFVHPEGQWSLIPNAGISGGSYGVRLYVTNFGTLDASLDNKFFVLKRQDASTTFFDFDGFESSTSITGADLSGRIWNLGAGYAEKTGFTSMSEFVIGSLPVTLSAELAYFNLNCESDRIDLKWATASEVNNKYFRVSTSTDGLNFEVTGTVQGAINSSTLNMYEFTDWNPSRNTSYYRLTQVDMDGTETELALQSAYYPCSGSETTILVYPNPVQDNVFITLNDSEKEYKGLFITNAMGQVIVDLTSELKINGLNQIHNFDSSNLASGIYYVNLVTDSGMLTEKFTKN